MTRNLLFSAVPVCMALQLAALPTRAIGQEVFGGVDGVARDSASKQPLAQVRITAHNIGLGTDATAISGSDGAFRDSEAGTRALPGGGGQGWVQGIHG